MSPQLLPAKLPKLASVPAFPTVVMKLLNLLSDEQSSIAGIAACISTDPIIAGRVLKRANAGDLAHAEVRDLLQAILLLGVERTREVALATATLAYVGSAMEMELLRPCWHHTVATAIAASEIARLCGLRPAECYTAALLHDIGRLGLLTAYPIEYAEIMEQSDGRCDGLRDLERARFGADHNEAGLWLARKWNLPDSVAEVISRHHDAPVAGPLNQLTIVQVACRMADLLGFSVVRQPDTPPDFDEITAPLPESARNQLWSRISALQDSVLEQIAFFGRVEAPKVAAPLEVTVDEEELLALEIPQAFPRRGRSLGGRAIFLTIAALVAIVVILLIR